jgi:predicted ATPase/DNA-binding winged helix-turn-helix (wHTH) protein
MHQVYRFGDYELRPAARALRRGDTPLRIGARAFDLLLALVEAGGAPLSRQALFDRAWPGRAVLDDNLKVQVMALRRLLGAEAVQTVPGHGYRLGLPLLAPGPTTSPGTQWPSTSPDRLHGRSVELQALRAMLAPRRVVSVVGPGGIGKTRLARAAAVRADGQVMVELAPLADPARLVGTIADALALPPTDSEAALAAALRPLALLLVLDNAEHLRDALAALLQRLLPMAPRVSWLVTSQEPLGLGAEQVLRLDGLALPAADDPAGVAASPAGALFAARAGSAFEIDAGNAAAVAAICRRLDGIPLAIELAAARAPLLGAAGVNERLDEPLALLARPSGSGSDAGPARQRTLRAALAWSHGLLDAGQQVVWRRLAVFAGGFEVGSAQRVATAAGGGEAPALDGLRVFEHLETLVAKSMLQVVARSDRRRLRLPEAARAFARERLDAAGETAALRRRHAEAVLDRFAAADARHTAEPALGWTEALMDDLPDLRAALAWARGDGGDGGDLALAIALAAAAGSFWAAAGLDAEAREALRALQPSVDERVPLATRARFWFAVANRGADASFGWDETADAAARAVELARAAGDAALQHRALARWQTLALRAGRPVDSPALIASMRALEGEDWNVLQRRARRWAEDRVLVERGDWAGYAERQRRELRLLSDAGDDFRAWAVAHNLALAEIACGRPAAAWSVMQPVAAAIRARGLARRCWMQVAMAAMAAIEADAADEALLAEAVRLMQGAGGLGWMPCHLADWLARQGRLADAARCLGWAEHRYAARGEAPSGHGEAARQRVLARLERDATPAQRTAWQAEGAAMDDDQLAALFPPPP